MIELRMAVATGEVFAVIDDPRVAAPAETYLRDGVIVARAKTYDDAERRAREMRARRLAG